MSEQVENYGLHWDGEVAWLVQGRGGNNFVGLKGQCPFKGPKLQCNHLVPVAAPIPDKLHWNKFEPLLHDPLVEAMFPVPHDAGQNVFFVEDAYNDLSLYLSTLSRLSSPINSVVKPAWSLKARQLEKELVSTNIQPLVIVQTTTKEQALIDLVRKMAAFTPRTVIFTGADDVVVPGPIQKLTTDVRKTELAELMTLPMESLGAFLLRRFCRHEDLDAPMETREERRARMFKENQQK